MSDTLQKFQDNLFEPNAISPTTLAILAQANVDGVVERYIYLQFREKQRRILAWGKRLEDANPIVCKDSEADTIERVCQQLGQRIQGIIVQSQLANWYDQALRGDFSNRLGKDGLDSRFGHFHRRGAEAAEFLLCVLGVSAVRSQTSGPKEDQRRKDLLTSLRREFRNEFPFSETFEPFYKERGYPAVRQTDSPFRLSD